MTLRRFDDQVPDLDGSTILVTGGTGSFGRRLIDAILARHKPQRLVVFSRDEQKHYDMSATYPLSDHSCLDYMLGDVRDPDRLEIAMRGADVVIHAAAQKHIGSAEIDPFECIRTNVVGAENVVRAALRTGTKRVIALSTDKAANPVNLYGASKFASDKIFITSNRFSGKGGPLFSVVRYGNVVGSRGSVVPLFERLVRDGATTLPITDMRMTRFWITLQQSVSFVLSSLALMRGGDLFVPKIPSMRVVDLARAMAPDASLTEIGARPGEKLHETLITEDEARRTYDLGDRFVIEPAFPECIPSSHEESGSSHVQPDFTYASDTNLEWLDAPTMSAMLAETR